MPNYASLNNLLQYGQGLGAQIEGQPYNLYRVTNLTPAGGILSGLPLYTNVPVVMRKAAKTVIEGESFSILTMNGMCDNRQMQLGDVLVEQNSVENAYYAVAQMRPLMPTLFVRCEQTCIIQRPIAEGGAFAQMPQSGSIFQSNYGGTTDASSTYVMCTNGVFTYADDEANAASFPIGLTPTQRIKSMRKPDFVNQLPDQQYIAYIPYIPGLGIAEADNLLLSNGQQFEIVQMYDSEGTGLSGYICIVNEVKA
jgi:hypothetical protein